MKSNSEYSFIAIADVHLGAKLFNLPELAQDLKDAFSQAIDKAVELKVSYFIVVGDLYEHNKPQPDLIQFVRFCLNRLKQAGIAPIGIAGDHDKPINGSAWVHISGFYHINDDNNLGRFLGYDYTDNSPENVQKIIDHPNKYLVEWIFLHGQVPELFAFCEEKKLLDLKKVDLIGLYPNLKGIVLGDIHKPYEGTIADPTMSRAAPPYIGYCGSLGIVRLDEVDHKIGLLYYDGQKLNRLPFKLDRDFYRVDVKDLFNPVTQLLEQYYKQYKGISGKKPVFLVESTKDSKDLLGKLSKLYEVAIVRSVVGRKDQKKEEVINIRSELSTSNRVEEVLKELIGTDPDLLTLTLNLIKEEDPKRLLDTFKETSL